MTDRHGLLCLLALQGIFSLNPGIAAALIREAGDAKAAFKGDRNRFRRLFGNEEALWGRFKKFDDWGDCEKILKKIEARDVSLIGTDDECYPKLLRHTYDPPQLIMALGNGIDLLSGPIVAIVGARKASTHAKNVAFEMAEFLSARGITVASGMAYGIDAAAHRGALEGGGRTVAVLGTGIDVIYPSAHRDIYNSIIASGVVISEFGLGTIGFPSNFPQRNRIISGMSLATVIVEAAERSGSLITARLALGEGREVYAVPGLAGASSHRGTNRLIKDGAPLVESGQDVLELVQKLLPIYGFSKNSGHFGVDVGKDSEILNAFEGSKGYSIDEVVLKTGRNTSDVIAAITSLVVEGAIFEVAGQKFMRRQCQIP